MRIFQVCGDPGIPPDGTKGASVHLRAIRRALERAGHRVTTFTRRPPAGPPGPGWHPLHAAEDLLEAARRNGAPDLVYERYALGCRLGLEAARTLDKPFVLEVNAPLAEETRRYRDSGMDPRLADFEAGLFREAELLAAVSEPLRAYAAGLRGTGRGTVVVPNGCDPVRPAPPSAGSQPATLVFLGHPKPWHGADRLPRLLAGLEAAGHADVRLLVIGGGPGAGVLEDTARELGVARRVTVTGPVPEEDVPGLLAEAALGIAPYPSHPFFYFCPLKLLACMAAGLPVVTTEQGDLRSLVGDGGLLVPPGDEQALQRAVAELLQSPARRRFHGERARRRVLEQLTWDHAAQRLLEAFEEHCGRAVA